MISSVSKMYPIAAICWFWARHSLCVARMFWLPCHISKRSLTLAIVCDFLSSASLFISMLFTLLVVSRWWVVALHYTVIGLSKLPYNYYFMKGHAYGFRMLPIANILLKGKFGPQSDTMWYDWSYVACDIREIGVLWVHFLLLSPPVCYIQYPQCTANSHWVGVVMIKNPINLPADLWWFRQRIQNEPCGGQ